VICKLQSIERWTYKRFHVPVFNHESDMFGCNRELGLVCVIVGKVDIEYFFNLQETVGLACSL